MGSIEVLPWQKALASATRTVPELLQRLSLSSEQLNDDVDTRSDFVLRVTDHYLSLMTPGDPSDPLLRQVLPLKCERDRTPGFVEDPLLEVPASARPGILHKYRGRVLLILTQACAIHCRYCFRRNFPYNAHQQSGADWLTSLDYVRQDTSIQEVILSGGDPLLRTDTQLESLFSAIEAIPHVRRLRIHTRLPVVLPERFTPGLCQRLGDSRMKVVLVNHANHPNELDDRSATVFRHLRAAGVTLLNQTVLLRGINDDPDTLSALCEKLFEQGMLPYYLHLTDRVRGTAHFYLSRDEAMPLYQALMSRLPGYLVPKLAEEIPGRPSKTWWTPNIG
ncbi:MAG: EF-P beta-lysylation protein EpmB [Gammaproteobacteria bacterium]|nr:MAG: EF-P beta-lysylation protein EpmB [Gammaproteobacteria bacterium]